MPSAARGLLKVVLERGSTVMCSLSHFPARAISVSGALAMAFSGGVVFGALREIQGASSPIRVHVPPGFETPSTSQARAQRRSGPDIRRRWRLLETAIADDPRQSSAVVQDPTTGALYTFSAGDRLDDGRVQSIERMRVVVEAQGEAVVLDASQDPMPQEFVGPGRAAPFGRCTEDTLLADPRPPTPLVFRVPRWVESRLAEAPGLNDLAMQARVVPTSHPSGFKLLAIRPGSVFSLFGLRNGDIIRRIAGREIDSPDRALEVYAELKEATSVDLEIERNGVPIRHRYILE